MRQGKLNMHIIFKCADAVDRKLSKLVHAFRNYSLSKFACFFETQCTLTVTLWLQTGEYFGSAVAVDDFDGDG